MGIGYFPSPRPDELFYSLCARYHDRVRYPKTGVCADLFGKITAYPSVALPRHLRHFEGALPPRHPYSVERVVEDHTFFPLCRPFSKQNMLDRVMRQMAGSTVAGQALLRSIGRSIVRASNRLRFCPGCVEEERLSVGECHWHRLHQVSGVEVCPAHQLFLENSDVASQRQCITGWYIPAERVASSSPRRPLNPADATHQCLLRAARDMAWLLGRSDSRPMPERLLDRYMAGLAEKGLVKRTGSLRKIRQEALNAAFVDFFPAHFLRLYERTVGGGHDRPHGFLRRLGLGRPGFITRHLVMLQFLGYTAESFFGVSAEPGRAKGVDCRRPFGGGPWPCLNPVAPHAREFIVETCRVTKSEKGGDLLMGTFSCRVCGFAYRRTGPDTSANDRLRFDNIRSYGPVWEEALKTFWADQSLSAFRMAARLGVMDGTVKRQALRLGLPFPRVGPRSSVVGPPRRTPKTFTRPREEWLKTRESYRKGWLRALRQNPGITRSALASLQRRLYSWLYHNDREWLDRHKPSARYVGGGRELDWGRLDSRIAGEVRREADRLKKLEGRPVRVSKTVIGANIGRLRHIRSDLAKLPLTTEALNEAVDSQRDFDARRLEWAARQLALEGVALKKTSLILRASFGRWPGPDRMATVEAVLLNAHEPDASTTLEAA